MLHKRRLYEDEYRLRIQLPCPLVKDPYEINFLCFNVHNLKYLYVTTFLQAIIIINIFITLVMNFIY